jgi:dephospho-CoA kinase
MLRVGLTGGIATGKTTVAAILRELGFRMLDADKIAHHLIAPGAAAYEDVVREFGRGILSADGRVDRQKLGAIVFADPPRLARLNAIVHPGVLDEQDRELAAIEAADPEAIAVVEAALLIEAGYARKLDFLVVTWCTPGQQLARLTRQDAGVDAAGVAGRGLTMEQARQRIAAQMPNEEKRRMADEVIDCSGSLEHTREQVVALVAKLKRLETEQGLPAGQARLSGRQASRTPREVDQNDRSKK